MDKPKIDIVLWSVKKIYDLRTNIDLDTDYQREKIWSEPERALLIDSILNEIDIPKIYLARRIKKKKYYYECIDGKQRLISIFEFIEGNLKINGKTIHQINESQKERILNYELTISIIENPSDNYIYVTFKRLQLGKRLNAGETLKSKRGEIRDFLFITLLKKKHLLNAFNLSDKRFSKLFTLAQISLNYFHRNQTGHKDFVKSRLGDLEPLFEKNITLTPEAKETLNKMKFSLVRTEKAFAKEGARISSRAAVISAFFFIDELIRTRRSQDIPKFVEFYIKLLDRIDEELGKINEFGFENVTNKVILSEFQTNITQASVEGYSIKRRHEFLRKAFYHYKHTTKTTKIIGDE